MAKKSDQLKMERSQKQDAQQVIVDKAKTEKREFTPEEEAQFDAIQGEIDTIDKSIERELKVERLELDRAQRNHRRAGDRGDADEPDGETRERSKIYSQFRMGRAIGVVSEHRQLDGVEKEVNDIAIAECRALNLEVPTRGISIPASMLRSDGHTVTQDGGAYGGVLVKESGGEMLTPFIPRLTVEDLGVKVLMNLTGDYPLYSSDQFDFQNLAETDAATPQKAAYYKSVMKPKRSACVALISNQLIIQSSIDVENDIRAKIGTALNRRVLIDLINGSGTGANPLGLLNDQIYVSTAAQGPLTLAKILELENATDSENATSEKLAFLMHNKLAGIAKAIPVDPGSGLFLMDINNKLYGTDTYKTTQMPVLVGTGSVPTYPLIYGDWDAARVGFWGGMNILADPYTAAASNELRLIINVHKDSRASNPKAFAVNKSITLS